MIEKEIKKNCVLFTLSRVVPLRENGLGNRYKVSIISLF